MGRGSCRSVYRGRVLAHVFCMPVLLCGTSSTPPHFPPILHRCAYHGHIFTRLHQQLLRRLLFRSRLGRGSEAGGLELSGGDASDGRRADELGARRQSGERAEARHGGCRSEEVEGGEWTLQCVVIAAEEVNVVLGMR